MADKDSISAHNFYTCRCCSATASCHPIVFNAPLVGPSLHFTCATRAGESPQPHPRPVVSAAPVFVPVACLLAAAITAALLPALLLSLLPLLTQLPNYGRPFRLASLSWQGRRKAAEQCEPGRQDVLT